MSLSLMQISEVVARALREDIGRGDITTDALIPAEAQATALVVLREDGVVAGLSVLTAVFGAVDPALVVEFKAGDGERVAPDTTVATVRGSVRSLLTGERVALNLFQRMCGVATLTASYVAAVEGTRARILDTRKTTPGLRVLEKYAVRQGGGVNHRFGLDDAVLIKDNHLELLRAHGLGVADAVRQARQGVGPLVAVEVEVEHVADAWLAAEAGADMILLDNMPPALLREAVAAVGGRVKLEASGGITLATIRAVAESGVDYISVGALTHGARALDVGLDLVAA